MEELKPGGAQIPVTESNKKEYLDLLAQYRLATSVKQEIEAFVKGTIKKDFASSLSIFSVYSWSISPLYSMHLLCPRVSPLPWAGRRRESGYEVDYAISRG